MPSIVKGVSYYSVSEIADEIGISRQTLWRWRTEGLVPQGRRFGGRQIVFTDQEVQEIRDYAHRLEPLDPSARDQFRLFDQTVQGGRR